jgi:glyceraldehyde 3-phosphate dehydrogenase
LAPVLKVLDDNFGVQRAFFNTVHPYTNNQALHDGPHGDLRRSRAALINIIPTTSSAVNALKPVMPHLTHHINGFATRVPVPLGAYIEMTAQLKNKTSVLELNESFKKASQETMKGIIEYCTDPIVSTDIIGNKHSAIFDSLCTQIIDDDFVQILAWYDNETAYSHRVVNLLQLVYKL